MKEIETRIAKTINKTPAGAGSVRASRRSFRQSVNGRALLAFLIAICLLLAEAFPTGMNLLNRTMVAKAEGTGTDSDLYIVENSEGAVTWTSGTYRVESNAAIAGRITVSGNVKLVLCDGATLTAEKEYP